MTPVFQPSFLFNTNQPTSHVILSISFPPGIVPPLHSILHLGIAQIEKSNAVLCLEMRKEREEKTPETQYRGILRGVSPFSKRRKANCHLEQWGGFFLCFFVLVFVLWIDSPGILLLECAGSLLHFGALYCCIVEIRGAGTTSCWRKVLRMEEEKSLRVW